MGAATEYRYHRLNFPGTIHIEPEVFIQFCLCIIKSVAYHGFPKILIVNDHGSNTPLVDLVDEFRAWPIAPCSDQQTGPVQSQIRW